MYLIEQNRIDIQCDSQSLGKAMHAQLSELVEREFYPKLELLFNQYDSPNYVWNINQLVLNLPDLTQDNWKTDFVNLSLLQVEEFLKNNKPIAIPFLEFNNNQNIELISKQQQAVELFFYYLETGILTENTIAKQTDNVWENIEITSEFLANFLEFLEAKPKCVLRLVFGVSIAFRERIKEKITHFPVALNRILKLVFRADLSYFTQQIQSIKKLTKDQELALQWIDFLVFTNLIFNVSTTKHKLLDAFIKNAAYWNLMPTDLNAIFSAIETQMNIQNEAIPLQELLFITEIKTRLGKENDFSQSNPKSIEKSVKEEKTISSFQFISNAGLVLLHPFLYRLFDQLKLHLNGEWKDIKSQHKAILLTQFLVTGNTVFFENELILNKIFCGLEINNVVNTKLKIAKKEKETCQSLLKAVLEHWSTMNSSSVEALRESFLMRDGKLDTTNPNSYELFVEEKGYDILLAQLPWGIGMIKTPWMEHYLNCNWA